MKNLTINEQNQLLNEIFKSDTAKRDYESVMAAYKIAAKKFDLKIRKTKSGYFERIYLTTNWQNCDKVWDYLSDMGISVTIINDKIGFSPNIK